MALFVIGWYCQLYNIKYDASESQTDRSLHYNIDAAPAATILHN
jgi:hypothetical protein